MSGTGPNEGIYISGGKIEAGAIAAGRDARANNYVGAVKRDVDERGYAELVRRLEDLLRQLDAHAAQLANADELKESTRVVADELAKERPNKTTVTGILTGIAESTKSVAGLATAAWALIQAVHQYL